ncbi:MAG: hypothetical protein WC866_03965 [Patescibacteria group bacterium]|jgi:hypothetical protein
MTEQHDSQMKDDTERDVETLSTGASGKAERTKHSPAESLEGKTITPDLRIDLNAEDAIEKLNQIHAELGSPPEAGEAETVTEEDEREFEETLAKIDERTAWKHAMDAELFDADSLIYRETEEAARELCLLARAGYEKSELERIANSLVDAIMKNRKEGEGLSTKESTLAYLRRRYELLLSEAPVEDTADDDPTQSA